MQDDILLQLKSYIFSQAEVYLLDVGGFAPFGATYKNDMVQPVAYNDENQLTGSEKTIGIIKNFFAEDIRNAVLAAGCVAYDVAMNVPNADGEPLKRDALCLETSINGINWVEEYFPYMIIEGQCVWV